MWGQSTLIIGSLSQKRDWGPQRLKGERTGKFRGTEVFADESGCSSGVEVSCVPAVTTREGGGGGGDGGGGDCCKGGHINKFQEDKYL